jgi:hypothetical protein
VTVMRSASSTWRTTASTISVVRCSVPASASSRAAPLDGGRPPSRAARRSPGGGPGVRGEDAGWSCGELRRTSVGRPAAPAPRAPGPPPAAADGCAGAAGRSP